MTEAQEQTALFAWSEYVKAKYPGIQLMFHIPNGGKRGKIEAARLKQQGVKAGVPDIFLPVPRARFHGMFIEMKSKDGVASKEQREWISELTRQGYFVTVCYGFDQAKTDIEAYMNLPTIKLPFSEKLLEVKL